MQARLTTKPAQEVIAAIQALDLEPVKIRLMDPELGEGWSRDYADSIAVAYKTYLTMLVKYPEDAENIMLSEDVDEFWHTHILQTRKYATDCQNVFGNFLHHEPHVGEITAEDLKRREAQAERTRALYEQEFGNAMGAAAAWTGAAFESGRAAYSGASIAAPGAAYSGASLTAQRAAYSGASIGTPRAAYSGASIEAKRAAYSGASISGEDAAYSGASISAARAAYSGASIAAERAAYSGASINARHAAYSGASIRAGNAAYSGASIRAEAAAYSGATIKASGASRNDEVQQATV